MSIQFFLMTIKTGAEGDSWIGVKASFEVLLTVAVFCRSYASSPLNVVILTANRGLPLRWWERTGIRLAAVMEESFGASFYFFIANSCLWHHKRKWASSWGTGRGFWSRAPCRFLCFPRRIEKSVDRRAVSAIEALREISRWKRLLWVAWMFFSSI